MLARDGGEQMWAGPSETGTREPVTRPGPSNPEIGSWALARDARTPSFSRCPPSDSGGGGTMPARGALGTSARPPYKRREGAPPLLRPLCTWGCNQLREGGCARELGWGCSSRCPPPRPPSQPGSGGARLRWTQEPSSGGALMSRGHTVALPHRPLAEVRDEGRPGCGSLSWRRALSPDLA